MKEENKKIEDAIRFYLLATSLKYKIRSGWDSKHWNVSKDRLESIAEHIYGTCILAISLDSEFDFNIDLNRVIKMLVIHELEEVQIGDITPFDSITPEEKLEQGHKAILNVIGDLVKKEELVNLIHEFDNKETEEAKFAFHCDKLEADIQAKVYEDNGYQHMDNQDNNVVMQSSLIKQILNSGATTVFDVWYSYDKDKFIDDDTFMKTLDFVKTKNTNELKNI